MIPITADMIEAASLGGCLLGGGGGGSMEKGMAIGRLALEVGLPRLASIDEMPAGATIVTASAVGAPAAERQFCKPMHYVRAVELLRAGGVAIDGLVTSENGGLATLNGWFQSAVLGIPVVDAPCNGRAHPTGTMGSMGLHRLDGYVSRQAAAGGNPDAGAYTEIAVSAALAEAARLVRQAAVSAGGMVAVARNPVTAAYAREHAAVGAIGRAIEVGKRMLAARQKGAVGVAAAAAGFLGGEVVAEGEVEEVSLETRGGFDVGRLAVRSGGTDLELTFWNEYMTLERRGERLATFPDLIATVDASNGRPLPTAEVRRGLPVAVVTVPAAKLILGAGMRDPALFRDAEEAVGLSIIRYSFKS